MSDDRPPMPPEPSLEERVAALEEIVGQLVKGPDTDPLQAGHQAFKERIQRATPRRALGGL
jgi:hypothetical protein